MRQNVDVWKSVTGGKISEFSLHNFGNFSLKNSPQGFNVSVLKQM